MAKVIEYQEFDDIKGLFYFGNIGKDLTKMIKKLDNLNWKPITNNPNSRLVQHYGYIYDYNNYDIAQKGKDMPDFIDKLRKKLTLICKKLNLIDNDYIFNQCIVNNYEAGQSISKHIDVKSYGAVIGCFTIGSGATMKFSKNDEYHDLYVAPNSLYIMSSDARYVFKHEMTGTKYDNYNGQKIERGRRISITFRMVNN
jgi:alkylated DNA repair dioxygenase AlkB